MASISDYLDSMVVSATSPDQNIRVEVSNYTDVRVTFRPGSYNLYDEERLAHQLARLGVSTWVAYQRARSEAHRRSLGLSSTEFAEVNRASDDPHRSRYEEELRALEAEGRSTSGALRIRTRGMAHWDVDIEAGALRRFREDEFLSEIHSAVASLLERWEIETIALKSAYFDLGLPGRWRNLLTELRAATRP